MKGNYEMKQLKLNQKGFSLVELMVVVAIIGILATIGIPQYQKFMAKARQAEAKGHLNSIFQGESSFFTEYNGYTTNLSAIGVSATGIGLRYNAGFANGTACTNYAVLTAVGAPAAGANATNDLISVSPATTTWYYSGVGIVDSGAGACDDTAGAQSYTAGAWGNPTNTAQGVNNNSDQFTINNNRLITQTAIGI